ncbi:hypothetical protein AURDEDRAFT_130974 [Auricularia subglabra TFB-10046 SS5]|uniref:Uncharacterized protein n=1 Tax=Auricularia subglabra (strain TFB-10046 / SS5) TaxID=717982 RepID=J0WRZ4_AURST|nr:hypothetical protein AURDEDRAFT_130974 [Auricularia subglabra TFB-10046 SS5]
MSSYNLNVSYATSNTRGGQQDAPAASNVHQAPVYAPPPPPPHPAPLPVLPPMRCPDSPPPPVPPHVRPAHTYTIVPPVMRQVLNHPLYGHTSLAPIPPVQNHSGGARPRYNDAPFPPVPSHPDRRAPRPPPQMLVAYNCPHPDCAGRVLMVVSPQEHMWIAHGVRI